MLLLIRDQKDVEEAEIIREKGTNRSKFFRGQIDKYTWVNYGSSYLPSDMNAAYLYAQLEIADEINDARLACWNRYYEQLKPLKDAGKIDLPYRTGRLCTQCPYVLYQGKRPGAEDTVYQLYEGERRAGRIPLHSAAYRSRREEIRTLPWGGPLYHQRERTSGQTSHVLRTDAGSGRLYLWSDKRFL